MTIPSFEIARLPRILFGAGRVQEAPAQVAAYGERVPIVTGRRSFRATARWEWLLGGLGERGIEWRETWVTDEPSPGLVDRAVDQQIPGSSFVRFSRA